MVDWSVSTRDTLGNLTMSSTWGMTGTPCSLMMSPYAWLSEAIDICILHHSIDISTHPPSFHRHLNSSTITPCIEYCYLSISNSNFCPCRYSKDFLPKNQRLVNYFNDFAKAYDLNIQYNTSIKEVNPPQHPGASSLLIDQHHNKYQCKYVSLSISPPSLSLSIPSLSPSLPLSLSPSLPLPLSTLPPSTLPHSLPHSSSPSPLSISRPSGSSTALMLFFASFPSSLADHMFLLTASISDFGLLSPVSRSVTCT